MRGEVGVMAQANGWLVRVMFDQSRLEPRLVIYRSLAPVGGGIEVACPDGTYERIAEGELLPEKAWIRLPQDALDDLFEFAAGQSHLGAENRVLRESLKREADRVDRLLGRATIS
jgi:hypothetical protein